MSQALSNTGTIHPLTPNVTPTTLAAGDFVADSSDINTLSQGKINSMSLGNSNVWVGTDLNQQVVGNTTTESMGNVSNTYHNKVTDNFDTWHEENSDWHHEFTGFHTEIVGVHGEFTAAHVEATGVHIEQKEGLHITLNAAFGFHGQDGYHAENFLAKSEETGTKTETTVAKVITSAEVLETVNTALKNYVTKTEMTAAMHSIKAGIFSVQAGTIKETAVDVSISGLLSVGIKCVLPGGIKIG